MQHYKLESIQILRGVAAIFVVISHLCTKMRDNHPASCLLACCANLGGIGVDIFFVISGFIMVVTTAGRPDGLGASLNFLRKRVLGTQIQPDLLIVILTIFFPAICVQAYRFVETPLITFTSEKWKPRIDRSIVPAS